MSRSGETPREVLGGTKGALVVDGCTGYNDVTGVNGRTRAGCNAHSRRYFFEAQQAASVESQTALDFILGLYRVEYDARDAGVLGTSEHLAMRQSRSRLIREVFKKWLDE